MMRKLLNTAFGGFLFIILLCAGNVSADQTIAVGIFPFSIHSAQTDDSIGSQIPLMIAQRLEEESAKSQFFKEIPDVNSLNEKDFKEIGIQAGMDYLVTGSIFQAGDSISIDVMMTSVYNGLIVTFFAEAQGSEHVLSAVNTVSRDIISVIFQKQIIADISVSGNIRVEADAIQAVIESKTGDIFTAEKISQDLNLIYKMGYFEAVTVKKTELDTGIEIIFQVTEKPSVRRVKFVKNHVFKDKELIEVVGTRTGSILNIFKINEDITRIKRMYTEKNYHNCSIDYTIEPLENNQADLIFTVDEGEKLRILKISFQGNANFTDRKLKKAMESSEKDIFSWLTSSGKLDEIKLNNDSVRIESFYKNNGYADAKVSNPEIVFEENGINVSFKIEEGQQYRFGHIEIIGDLVLTQEELLNKIEARKSEIYNRETVRKDVITISDIYSDKGFANVDVRPLVKTDNDTIGITFNIDKGSPVYFDRVIISGNLKTRDKVIRREVLAQEQALFSKSDVQRSFRNLNRLNYFQKIDITPTKTTDPNRLDLMIDVDEKTTGAFSFGGGYSDVDNGFLMVSLTENNLFGRGQYAEVKAQVSQNSNRFTVSFTEPWLFDIPLVAGFDIYKWDYEYNYYDKDAMGIKLRTSYRIFDYVRIGTSLNFEQFEISNNLSDYTNVTPGTFFHGSISPFISYDSRDKTFIPTEGGLHKFTVEYAGEYLGGEIDYIKYIVETGWHFPLFWKLTGHLHAEAGFLDDRTKGNIDIDYQRFYLGGMNSIRGFDRTDINTTETGERIERGGEKYVLFNAEILFPLYESQALYGVVFYDQGDVYRDHEDITIDDQFSSYGLGVRWDSPVGPIRIEYGIVIEGKDKRERGKGQWGFSVGAYF